MERALSLRKTLEIRTSPHVLSGHSVDSIMFNVVLALLPVTAFAVYAFGLAALLTLATALASCLLAERLTCRMAGHRSTLNDWSATITGLLYGLTLPPGLPLWMVVVGGFVGVWLGKSLFGGLGYNPLNPALVGRAFLQAAFPVAMTSWVPGFAAGRFASLPSSTLTAPFTSPIYDGITGATPLALWKFERVATDAGALAFGFTSGSTGEASAALIVLGGAYLIARNMMNWRIPASILATVALLSGALHLADPGRYASPAFMLLSGGLMLGAMFMATDMVGSPMTGRGCVIYGAIIGALVVVIRTWGGMPEGVMYAILLGNALSPHLDRLIRPRVYGTRGRGGARGEKP
jgi:electron transport complex protein RnfD